MVERSTTLPLDLISDSNHPGEPSATSMPTPPSTSRLDRVEGLDVDDLRRLIATLTIIEQAKGMLMAYYGCDATAAFELPRRWSATRNMNSGCCRRLSLRPAPAPDLDDSVSWISSWPRRT